MPDVATPVERQGVVWDESGATVWISVKDEKVVKELRRYPIIAIEGRGPVVVRQRRVGPTSMEPMRSQPWGPAGGLFNNGKEKQEEGMKFSEVTRKMVEQLRKKAGVEEQKTEEGPAQRPDQRNEAPEAQKVGENEPPQATRPQGKGRRVRRRGQQRRGTPYGPRTAHESARRERDDQDLTHALQEHDGGEKQSGKVHEQEQEEGGVDELGTREKGTRREHGKRQRRRRLRSKRSWKPMQRNNETSRAANLQGGGERKEVEGIGTRESPINIGNRFEALNNDFEEEIHDSYFSGDSYDPFDRLQELGDDDTEAEESEGMELTPEQVQAKETLLQEGAQSHHHNVAKEMVAESEEQAALRVLTEKNSEKDGQRDRQDTGRDRESQELTNEQNDRTNDEQREGCSDGRTDGLNETQTTEMNDGHKDREENAPTIEMTGGLNEKNEQTVTQQQALATPEEAGTRHSRDSDDRDPGAGDAGSDDGKEPKGDEHKDVDSRNVTTDGVGCQNEVEEGDVMAGEGGPQREGDTKGQLEEEENAIAGDGASQSDGVVGTKEIGRQTEDTEARTGLEGLDGPDGAPASGSNFSNTPDASPVAGRTRGKRFLNSALTDQLHNSYTDVGAEVGRKNEVLTGNDQPRKGRRTGRMDNLTHEVRWRLRVRRS